jgi:hypothetical protein
MKVSTSLLIAFGLVSVISIKVEAANTFVYGMGETELYRTTFGTDFNANQGWTLNNTSVSQGVLKATIDNWSSAFYNLSSLDLDSGNLGIYWSFKTDRNTNERSKLYMELNVTDDPNRREQRHIAFNIVPKRKGDPTPYQLYVDPGFNLTNQLVQNIRPPSVLFNSINTFESFRMMVSKIDANTVRVVPFYWYNNNWNRFFYSNTSIASPVSLRIDINNYLERQDAFKSFSLLFRSNVPSVDAIAITQIPRPSLTATNVQLTSVPESNSIVGLITVGLLSLLAIRKCDRAN